MVTNYFIFFPFRTPMMDLLVQVCTAHKISPGGHVLQVINQRSNDFLYYKPSTPIGEDEQHSFPWKKWQLYFSKNKLYDFFGAGLILDAAMTKGKTVFFTRRRGGGEWRLNIFLLRTPPFPKLIRGKNFFCCKGGKGNHLWYVFLMPVPQSIWDDTKSLAMAKAQGSKKWRSNGRRDFPGKLETPCEKLSCLRTYVGGLVCGSLASDKDNVALVSNTIWQFTAVQGYVCFEKQGDEKGKEAWYAERRGEE